MGGRITEIILRACDEWFEVLADPKIRNHDVSRKLAQIILWASEDHNVDAYEVWDFLTLPLPPEFYATTSGAIRPWNELGFDTEWKRELLKDIKDITWKGVGRGELLLLLKTPKSERTENKDIIIDNKSFNVKHISSQVSLKPRPTGERKLASSDDLLREYFDGNCPGVAKSHDACCEIAKKKDVTDFFRLLWGEEFEANGAEHAASLLSEGCSVPVFCQEVGAMIHRADARIDKLDGGYLLVLDNGLVCYRTDDISSDMTKRLGFEYTVHFKRGGDTNAVADGYAKLGLSKPKRERKKSA